MSALKRLGIFLSIVALFVFLGATLHAGSHDAPSTPYFRITVIDAETGRGIPLVRLQINYSGVHWTDSAGVVAYHEPDLMGRRIWIRAESPGYRLERRGGITMNAVPGESGIITMQRTSVAQRLYRITGTGIYRDSQLLGDAVPPTQDLSADPLVTGQDTVDAVIYKGKVFWLWGDTHVNGRALGNFLTTCATSRLPEDGGLDPEEGIYLEYLRTADGNIRRMVETDERMVWLRGMRLAKDRNGVEHLYADYESIEGYLTAVGRGLVRFDDEKGLFVPIVDIPLDSIIFPRGTVFRHDGRRGSYFYHNDPWPNVRSPVDAESVENLASYEAFTCLKEGERFDGSAEQLDRDADGNLRWAWKKNTSRIDERQTRQLIRANLMRPEEQWYSLRDTNTTETVMSHTGTVRWNEYRNRWISIRSQNFGATHLGEIWYFEADTPMGPWTYGQKVITHVMREYPYSFYNPDSHPKFNKDGGRVIFIEGTYTAEFSGNVHHTPYYNYNQIMYKLELDDPRVFVPVAVYDIGGRYARYATKAGLPEGMRPESIPFFAPDRPREGTVPVYQIPNGRRGHILTLDASLAEGLEPVFHLLPLDGDTSAYREGATVPLRAFRHPRSGDFRYSTTNAPEEDGYVGTGEVLGRVWANPILFNPWSLM